MAHVPIGQRQASPNLRQPGAPRPSSHNGPYPGQSHKGFVHHHFSHLRPEIFTPSSPIFKRSICAAVHTKSVSRPRGCRRRNTKTRKPENGENAKHENGKKRKRENGKNKQSRKAVFAENKTTLQSIIALAIKDAWRWEKHKKMETRKLENGKKCSRFLVVWFCTEAVHSAALWTRRLSQLWACVKYVPKQSIP